MGHDSLHSKYNGMRSASAQKKGKNTDDDDNNNKNNNNNSNSNLNDYYNTYIVNKSNGTEWSQETTELESGLFNHE